MKKLSFLILFLFTLTTTVYASSYGIYSPQKYSNTFESQPSEKILFIMDYSNSMNESLENSTKVDLMLQTMAKILPQINPQTSIGLRIYGHKMGFTPVDACRASSLAVPINRNNSSNIGKALYKTSPKGMTPITYSLRQAVTYDFMGFNGKKHIILLTDGGENCDESPCKYVMDLIKIRRDIKIDVIAFNIKDSDDLEQLQCTALVTSGKFYNAQTAAELLRGFDDSLNGTKNVEAKIIIPH